MAHPRWAEGLSVAGLYYDGVVDERKLQEVLELHKRDSVSTFGTRSSRIGWQKIRAPATLARSHPLHWPTLVHKKVKRRTMTPSMDQLRKTQW